MNQVMVVDDEAPMREALEAHFCREGWEVTTACGRHEALSKFRRHPCALVVSDMRMPDGDGLDVLRGLRQMAPEVGVIFLTAFGTVPDAVTAMREGACDYLIKPVRFEQLKEAAEKVLARPSAHGAGNDSESFVGRSANFTNSVKRARQAARAETDVLIVAESGTGKELLARLIHRESGRGPRPFVAVNCAAFPDALLESELFGYARGAFTGALAAKPGKFEMADGGTLLLDEIGELPLPLQPKLLRALQEREVDRLGDTRPVRVDVRVIATTNQPLATLVAEGKFRGDLYYRLNVVPLTIPPLRERRDDLEPLVDHFLRKYGGCSEQEPPRFSCGLLERLQAHSWPGNVRELENLVRRAIALHPGEILGPDFFNADERSSSRGGAAQADSPDPTRPSVGTTMREMERRLVESTLEAAGGNRTRAARALGICPRTMRNKIREFGLPPRRYA